MQTTTIELLSATLPASSTNLEQWAVYSDFLNRRQPENMVFIKQSPLSGNINVLELPVSCEEFKPYVDNEVKIQHIGPRLSFAQREFILSGITPEEWDKAFPDE